MCGIIGYVGLKDCGDLVVEGLSKLEYRGYDSAGIAVVGPDGVLRTRRAEGKLRNLVKALAAEPLEGRVGLGHTRWATHGGPTEANAHPHRAGDIAVVHNGIIENYLTLKRELQAEGRVFSSETDTEVIAHLVARAREQGIPFEQAVVQSVQQLEGAFALVVLDASTPDRLIVARAASPLVLGLGDGENFVASDIPAILAHTRDVVFLQDGTYAVVSSDGVAIRGILDGAEHPVDVRRVTWSPAQAEKGGFKHFMLKEIHEQPTAISDTLRGRLSRERLELELGDMGEALDRAFLQTMRSIYIVACGTSWHAGMVAQYLFEDLTRVTPHVELASELRYRRAPMGPGTLVIAVSQSGETADTLAAIRHAKAAGARVVSICNVIESSIARESAAVLYTHAGPEIGVASTKAFTTQLVCLHLMALHLGRELGHVDDAEMTRELDALIHAPAALEHALQDAEADSPTWRAVTQFFAEARSVLFLGRGALYPLALEGALKLKEISYIHAEGYAAGEMKHGPIALIEETVPTVVLHPRDDHHAKMRSNLQEVKARGGPVLAVVSEDDEEAHTVADLVVRIPAAHPHVLPLLAAVPMQLIAYHVADFRGTDVDQPRNLAKAVTVE